MNGAAFDAHAAVKALREAGAGERLAEAVTAVVRHAASADRGALATKADLHAAKADVGALEPRIYRALWLQAAGLVAIMVGLKIFG